MKKSNNDNIDFYEKFDWDRANLKSKLTEKIELIFCTLPDDVNSVIDVGCEMEP